MRVNHHASLACKSRNFRQQLARATDSKARRKAVAYASLSTTMPLFKQSERFAYGAFRLFMQRFRHAVAFVHHALAYGCSKARLFYYAKSLSRVIDRLHSERAGRPAFNHLRDGEPRRCSR